MRDDRPGADADAPAISFGNAHNYKGENPAAARAISAMRRFISSAREEAVALALPMVSTAAMQAMLDEIAKAVAPKAHAVILMDQAGWHCAHDLVVPDNLTLAFLPPYSPEFNVIEQAWLHLKERDLSHRVWSDYDDILDAVCEAWNKLIDEPGRIKSLTNADWLTSVKI